MVGHLGGVTVADHRHGIYQNRGLHFEQTLLHRESITVVLSGDSIRKVAQQLMLGVLTSQFPS